jgi:hypothetical protein
MGRDFIIDGTGRAVRPGDRVIVRQMRMTDNHGPGVLVEIADEGQAVVRLDCGIEETIPDTCLRREDDGERSGGRPLWSYR